MIDFRAVKWWSGRRTAEFKEKSRRIFWIEVVLVLASWIGFLFAGICIGVILQGVF